MYTIDPLRAHSACGPPVALLLRTPDAAMAPVDSQALQLSQIYANYNTSFSYAIQDGIARYPVAPKPMHSLEWAWARAWAFHSCVRIILISP